jgi:hypothetical protein
MNLAGSETKDYAGENRGNLPDRPIEDSKEARTLYISEIFMKSFR